MGLIAALIPYLVMLLNRSADTDASLILTFTHRPDLWRGPELLGYVTIILIAICWITGRLDFREPKSIALMSIALVAPIVFNQQVLTGRSLQPFHYQLFSANYVALIAISTTVFVLLKKTMERPVFLGVLSCFAIVMILVGCFEASYGASMNYGLNVLRDELLPVARRIKEISGTPEFRRQNPHPLIISFDFSEAIPVDSIDLPSISSQAVLWGPHLAMFPDVSPEENLSRVQACLYYQNLDESWLRNNLIAGESMVRVAFFGGVRSNDKNINDGQPLTTSSIDAVVERYSKFRSSFSYENARSPVISFAIVRRGTNFAFDAIDRWYERDEGEVVGEYLLYRLKLRRQG